MQSGIRNVELERKYLKLAARKMKVIGKRIKWIKVLVTLAFLLFLGVDIWLFYSYSQAGSPDSLLIAMSYLVLAIDLLLLVLVVLELSKQSKAIILEGDCLIVCERKKTVIAFKDIAEIKYAIFRGSGGGSKGIGLGEYKSGKITFCLNDGSKVKVSDIKEVKEVYSNLKAIVSNQE